MLYSLSNELIMITELVMEESSPGIWYYRIPANGGVSKIPPVSSDGSKDRYEEVWIEGWI